MVNLRARQYEPSVMRFVQRDLLKGDQSAPLSLNRYLYCENDSVNFVDPSGRSIADLWNKAKTAVSNGVAAVKKVAAAAYNAGKTIVKSAIQQVATVVKPVVNKVVNTVKEVATVAKTQGLVAAAKTLASNAAAVPAYVKNVVSATTAERQAIQAKSAQQIANTAKSLDKDLLSIGKDTYETLSPRNQKIIDDVTKTVHYMQQNGASQAAIDRVIIGACTQLAKNVGETVINGVKEELGKYLFSAPEEAARAFGNTANTLTKQTGNEHMAAIYSINVFGKKVYFNGFTHEGDKGSVATPFLATLLSGKILESATLGLIQYEGFSHTHPDDLQQGGFNWQFSDFQSNGVLSGGGDEGAAILAERCYMIDQNGKLYGITSITAVEAILNGESINKVDELTDEFKYRFDYGQSGEVYK